MVEAFLSAGLPHVRIDEPADDPEEDVVQLEPALDLRRRHWAFARVLAPVMLHPVEKDGKRSYEAREALKIEDPVSLSGDRVLEKVSCGGPI